jgi:hypothetical protein
MALIERPDCWERLLLRRRIGRRWAHEAKRLEYQAAESRRDPLRRIWRRSLPSRMRGVAAYVSRIECNPMATWPTC